MFAFSKNVKALEYRVIELEIQLKKLQDHVDAMNEVDIVEQVKDAINEVDIDLMAENAVERVIDNASLSIRF
jgi:predicted DNA-binding protein